MIYDVIISGAGPAGSSAAFELAKNGSNVLLIDKAVFPRDKICAGGLPPHLKEYNFNIDDFLESKANKILYSFKGKDKTALDFENFTIDMIMRKNFDFMLLNRAKEQKCKVNENEQLIKGRFKNELIEIETNKNKYKTKFLIGADGALSSTNRIFNIVKKYNIGVTLNAEIKLTSEKFSDFKNKVYLEIGSCKNGYFWSFPKKEHISVGMGSNLAVYKNFKKTFFRNLKYLNIADNDIVKIINLKGAPLPFFDKREKLNKGNVLLVGDAANLVDTLSGEGIYYAIKSGELAAYSILQNEKNNIPIDNYNNLLDDIIVNLEYSRKFAGIFFKYPKISYKLGVKNSYVNNLFKEMMFGNKTYTDLFYSFKKRFSKKFRFMVGKKNEK
jgi:geranylgeranyl reductase family protein